MPLSRNGRPRKKWGAERRGRIRGRTEPVPRRLSENGVGCAKGAKATLRATEKRLRYQLIYLEYYRRAPMSPHFAQFVTLPKETPIQRTN